MRRCAQEGGTRKARTSDTLTHARVRARALMHTHTQGLPHEAAGFIKSKMSFVSFAQGDVIYR